jgi:hypothetical protein
MLRRLVPLSFLMSLACFVAAPAHAAEVEFLRVWPAWRAAESFERIGEYFGGHESQPGQTVLRTQPEARAGYYFLVRVKSAAAIPDAKFQLSVIRPDAPDPKTYTFPAALPAKEAVFNFGLTGADWPAGKDAHPVAWKIALVGNDGRVLATHQSFLWEKPAK